MTGPSYGTLPEPGTVGGGRGAVSSVAGKAGAVTLVKGDVGLAQVDNTSDANKPLSTVAAAALGNKVDKIDRLGEKVFAISFGSAANEKADLYFTGSTNGVIQVAMTGQYATINSMGTINVVYSFSGNGTGTIFENTMTCTVAQGSLPSSFALTPITWDAANGRWKFSISHRNTSINPVAVRVSWQQTDTAAATALQNTLAVSPVYTTDATTYPAPVAQVAALQATVTTKQFGLGVSVVTDPQWGSGTGSDIGPAANAAIAAMPATGGRLMIPGGNWTTSQRIILKDGVEIEGAGRYATKITGSVEGVFGWSSHLSQWSIKNLRADSTNGHLMTTKGGDYSISQGELEGVWLVCTDTASSIFHHDSAWDYIKISITHSRLDRVAGSTRPGWYVRNSIGAANSNIWKNLWVQSYNNTLAPFFYVESTSPSSYAYDNTFEEIIGEQNRGGVIHLYNNLGGYIRNVVDWDAVGNYTGDLIKIGQSAAAPAFRSRKVTIVNCGRRGGALDAGVYDINLVPGQAFRCAVIGANHSSEPTSGLRINADIAAGQHDIINVPPDGTVYPGQPASTGTMHGSRVHFAAGIVLDAQMNLGNAAVAPGTPASGGVMYVEAGALKYKGSGGTVTVIGPA
ncbi:hypothetical protein [Actinoplanes sp. NPDC051494]|uniref:hypothetical protein n=1 Tax=Actinoplanes sp. NPDC051494 TaxID=3363907 RepID=UPI00378E35D6